MAARSYTPPGQLQLTILVGARASSKQFHVFHVPYRLVCRLVCCHRYCMMDAWSVFAGACFLRLCSYGEFRDNRTLNLWYSLSCWFPCRSYSKKYILNPVSHVWRYSTGNSFPTCTVAGQVCDVHARVHRSVRQEWATTVERDLQDLWATRAHHAMDWHGWYAACLFACCFVYACVYWMYSNESVLCELSRSLLYGPEVSVFLID